MMMSKMIKRTRVRAKNISAKYSSTLTASTLDKASFPSYKQEVAYSNNTSVTCGFLLIRLVSDGLKITSLNYVQHYTAAWKTLLDMEKQISISVTWAIESYFLRLILEVLDI
jgi:hypothetical protein